MIFKLLYPDKRLITDQEIRSWAKDAWWNNADDYVCIDCRQFMSTLSTVEDSSCEHINTDPFYDDEVNKNSPTDLYDCIDLLEDLGLATFRKFY